MKKNNLNPNKPKKRNHTSHRKESQAETIRAIQKAHDRLVGKLLRRFSIKGK